MISHRNPTDAGKRPAFDDRHAAPLIQILTWLFLAFSSLSIIAHFATKKALSRPTTKGDLILLAALVSGKLPCHEHIADRYTAVPGCRRCSCLPESRWPGNWKFPGRDVGSNDHASLEGICDPQGKAAITDCYRRCTLATSSPCLPWSLRKVSC